ncbi:MAG: MBOAT family protein [Candidatus Omnitrophica bacterium]|nr:MBOAT family protein [Candidatus Omnitrophota bacterium]
MAFTSHIFLFYFLPLVLLIYYLIPKGRNQFLLAAGYVFYAWFQPWFAFLLLAATVIGYAGGTAITRSADENRKHKVFIAALCANLALLGFFKYFTFLQTNLYSLLGLCGFHPGPVWDIPLPVGISFFTFLSISYLVSMYIGDAPPARSFSDFACYISLFPMVTAGPITRYPLIAEALRSREHTIDKFASGAALFILGFAKKILLADPMGTVANAVFGAEAPGTIDAWFGLLAYAFQIYFDFAGYSEMAVGLGRMVGFELIRNFNAPYRADSITDFWRRWHISLSTMLRDYVYVPLIAVGRNRSTKYIIYRNLILTFLICGLWHGAAWTFILWGGYHGLFLAFEQWRGKKGRYARLSRPVKIGLTFVAILLSWVLFRSPTLGDAGRYYLTLFGGHGASGGSILLAGIIYTQGNFLLMALCAALVFQPYQAFEWAERITPWKAVWLIALFAFSILGMFAQTYSPFLYSQF